MASLLKAMALVAYLNLPSVRDRPLHDSDRRLLGPMIRRSDNATASTVLRTVGAGRLYRLAERAEMRAFSFVWPVWGLSRTSAHDQARFFFRIDRLVTRRHRSYALRLLADIVAWQRWGIRRRVRPAGRSTSRAAGDPAPASSRTSPPPGERRPAARALDPHALEPEPTMGLGPSRAWRRGC